MLPLKPPYNRLHFINILLSPYICTFSDTEAFLHPYPIFSPLLNLNFLTWRTPKFKDPQILPGALFPTQMEPKEPNRPQVDPHIDYETGVCILLEDPAYRWFDLARTDLGCFFQKLPNHATHLKSPKTKHSSRLGRQLSCVARWLIKGPNGTDVDPIFCARFASSIWTTENVQKQFLFSLVGKACSQNFEKMFQSLTNFTEVSTVTRWAVTEAQLEIRSHTANPTIGARVVGFTRVHWRKKTTVMRM